jgi:hypothetical protein
MRREMGMTYPGLTFVTTGGVLDAVREDEDRATAVAPSTSGKGTQAMGCTIGSPARISPRARAKGTITVPLDGARAASAAHELRREVPWRCHHLRSAPHLGCGMRKEGTGGGKRKDADRL